MSENLHAPQRIVRRQVWLVALASLALAGCASSAGSVHAPSVGPSTSPMSAPTVTVTATPAPVPAPVTVTVAPPPAPAPAPVVQDDSPGTFRSPSGNINCLMYASGGDTAARCEVVEHSWVIPPPPDCHLNSGDRFYLTQGGEAGFGCYGQEFPSADETLAYGQARSLGALTCESEYTGMTCTDSSTGHYFHVSRDSYELG